MISLKHVEIMQKFFFLQLKNCSNMSAQLKMLVADQVWYGIVEFIVPLRNCGILFQWSNQLLLRFYVDNARFCL